jgi:hypothetical protein
MVIRECGASLHRGVYDDRAREAIGRRLLFEVAKRPGVARAWRDPELARGVRRGHLTCGAAVSAHAAMSSNDFFAINQPPAVVATRM